MSRSRNIHRVFRLSFTSRRCPHLAPWCGPLPGEAVTCAQCAYADECEKFGESECLVAFALVDSLADRELLKDESWNQNVSGERKFEHFTKITS